LCETVHGSISRTAAVARKTRSRPASEKSQSAADTLDELHARALLSNLPGPYAHADGHVSDPHAANL
jgi:hypothetical protein